MPYEVSFNLFPDINKFVTGSSGTSGVKEASIKQVIDDPGLNRTSPVKIITVP